MLNTDDKITFVRSVLNETYNIEALPFIEDGEASLKFVELEIDELLALNSNDVKLKRFEYFDIPNTTIDSYEEKVFNLGLNKIALAGIRHVAGNKDLPFINLVNGFELERSDIEKIKKTLKAEFKAFNPKYIAVWSKDENRMSDLSKNVEFSRRYLVGKIDELDLSHSFKDLKINILTNQNYFSWYESEYEKFHNSQPELKNWVTASNFEELENYRKQGLLYGVYVEDDLIGLIGGESLNLLGFDGVYMGEILLSEESKGRGLAPLIQKEFINKVKDRFDVIWGTIDAKNVPSTKTAMRVGRKCLRTECFIPLN